MIDQEKIQHPVIEELTTIGIEILEGEDFIPNCENDTIIELIDLLKSDFGYRLTDAEWNLVKEGIDSYYESYARWN